MDLRREGAKPRHFGIIEMGGGEVFHFILSKNEEA